jgi:hypothetical protein
MFWLHHIERLACQAVIRLLSQVQNRKQADGNKLGAGAVRPLAWRGPGVPPAVQPPFRRACRGILAEEAEPPQHGATPSCFAGMFD